jgi:hypothetical protein
LSYIPEVFRDGEMIGSRLLFLVLVAALQTAAVSAAPLPARAFERAELFANCAGRYAALATHQRGLVDGRPDEADRLTESFDGLLEAILPDALAEGVPDGQARRWRSDGWVEIAVLLRDMQYSTDQRRADAAGRRLLQQIASCRMILLPDLPDPGERSGKVTGATN